MQPRRLHRLATKRSITLDMTDKSDVGLWTVHPSSLNIVSLRAERP